MIKLFTHTDLDGVGCAILANLAFDSNVDIEYCNYDEINNKVNDFIDFVKSDPNNRYDMCHITDISINEENAEEISEHSDQFYLFDHHATALELNKHYWCTVKVEDENTKLKTCGTEIYYNWLVDNGYLNCRDIQIKEFVTIIRDYDTWRWASIGENGIISKKINDLLYIYGREKFIDWCTFKLCDTTKPFSHLSSSDELLLELKQQEIDAYINKKDKTLYTTTLCELSVGLIFAERFFSELGNTLCIRHPEIDFIAMIDTDGTVSYRAVKDDVDVSKIAKIYNGGGHVKAAGSMFDKDIMLKTMEDIFV